MTNGIRSFSILFLSNWTLLWICFLKSRLIYFLARECTCCLWMSGGCEASLSTTKNLIFKCFLINPFLNFFLFIHVVHLRLHNMSANNNRQTQWSCLNVDIAHIVIYCAALLVTSSHFKAGFCITIFSTNTSDVFLWKLKFCSLLDKALHCSSILYGLECFFACFHCWVFTN